MISNREEKVTFTPIKEFEKHLEYIHQRTYEMLVTAQEVIRRLVVNLEKH